ncbi:glutamate-5-semialdehyde dehydrogenase [Desulfocicer vacuolatum DSM 3385]|uniref:Gamma-glutamyl phosphate reductase n=1 Tax=Desulfocicer vacuolatum DSM 3385 TaxID=1121400 RepID=A0A1W2DA35_9BACT|nr:glutamate-5-semialdehyde dehydrogenase [Desulfocicer vacuolatum]SMC94361.1 glutamate-5-semialdehyde dehydrogenase [Desulfocicer vacuolatum DSM 3385]
MNYESTVMDISINARKAARQIAAADTDTKNKVLDLIGKKLIQQARDIFKENARDLTAAKEKGLSPAMLDRLKITDQTIDQMVQGLKEVAQLTDPVGAITRNWTRPNGLKVSKMRIPLGVIAMIYESRPNVTVDAAALCLKAGNATILRGGSEAFHSNKILADIIQAALFESGLTREIVQVLPVTDREAVTHLLKQEAYIDVVIPRGGETLIRYVVNHATMPVLKHYKGVCHVYVDETFDMDKALEICFNSKVHRPGVCNALETLLVHEKAAPDFLPAMLEKYHDAGVEIRGCEQTCKLFSQALPAEETDWDAEYLDLTLSVKVVPDMTAAMDHIAAHGSNHTDVIVTTHDNRAKEFIRRVDSSMVGVNASTRFNDGGQLGLGAEIGISTSKLHAFGPMGLEELTATKFVVMGQGHTRQ